MWCMLKMEKLFKDRTAQRKAFLLIMLFIHSFFFFQQIQLKDLLRTGNVKSTGLKGNSLMELMKLKPPPDIATPVATATATGQLLLLNV